MALKWFDTRTPQIAKSIAARGQTLVSADTGLNCLKFDVSAIAATLQPVAAPQRMDAATRHPPCTSMVNKRLIESRAVFHQSLPAPVTPARFRRTRIGRKPCCLGWK